MMIKRVEAYQHLNLLLSGCKKYNKIILVFNFFLKFIAFCQLIGPIWMIKSPIDRYIYKYHDDCASTLIQLS